MRMCVEMCCFDLVWWAKAKWGEQVLSVMDMMRKIENVEVPKRCTKSKSPRV